MEFALVLPLFLVLLFGTLDFGTAFNYWIDETHLANKAARWAAVDRNPSSGDSLQEYVRQQANTDELAAGVEVCISFPDPDSPGSELGDPQVGDPVRATVTYTYEFLPFLAELGGPSVGSVTIEGEATMRLEAAPSEYDAGCASA